MKKSFKIIISIFLIMFLFGCDSLSNTPMSKVEDLMSKYQGLDSDIDKNIDEVLKNYELTSEQETRYRKVLEKQYQNLAYEIKDDEIDGSVATVKVEIEVLDYRKVVDSVEEQYSTSAIYGTSEYIDYKLDALENAKDKVTYTINFTCTKDDEGNWKLDNLTNLDIEKIQGMY